MESPKITNFPAFGRSARYAVSCAIASGSQAIRVAAAGLILILSPLIEYVVVYWLHPEDPERPPSDMNFAVTGADTRTGTDPAFPSVYDFRTHEPIRVLGYNDGVDVIEGVIVTACPFW
jgi:hypothetical protein